MTPGPGGAAAGAGGWPPVGGPFCAVASDVPLKSSAIIAILFTVFIYTSECLRRTHPDGETSLRHSPFPGEQKKDRVSGPLSSFGGL
jgi:hypothetical protein